MKMNGTRKMWTPWFAGAACVMAAMTWISISSSAQEAQTPPPPPAAQGNVAQGDSNAAPDQNRPAPGYTQNYGPMRSVYGPPSCPNPQRPYNAYGRPGRGGRQGYAPQGGPGFYGPPSAQNGPRPEGARWNNDFSRGMRPCGPQGNFGAYPSNGPGNRGNAMNPRMARQRPNPEEMFTRMDVNGDGVLTKEEFMQFHPQPRAGQQPMNARPMGQKAAPQNRPYPPQGPGAGPANGPGASQAYPMPANGPQQGPGAPQARPMPMNGPQQGPGALQARPMPGNTPQGPSAGPVDGPVAPQAAPMPTGQPKGPESGPAASDAPQAFPGPANMPQGPEAGPAMAPPDGPVDDATPAMEPPMPFDEMNNYGGPDMGPYAMNNDFTEPADIPVDQPSQDSEALPGPTPDAASSLTSPDAR